MTFKDSFFSIIGPWQFVTFVRECRLEIRLLTYLLTWRKTHRQRHEEMDKYTHTHTNDYFKVNPDNSFSLLSSTMFWWQFFLEEVSCPSCCPINKAKALKVSWDTKTHNPNMGNSHPAVPKSVGATSNFRHSRSLKQHANCLWLQGMTSISVLLWIRCRWNHC